ADVSPQPTSAKSKPTVISRRTIPPAQSHASKHATSRRPEILRRSYPVGGCRSRSPRQFDAIEIGGVFSRAMRFLRWLGFAVAARVASVGAVVLAARFSDGPWGLLAGGPLTSGELVTGSEPDWSFAKDVMEIEFQLVDPPRSRPTSD